MKISAEHTFCYSHRLMDHPGKCRFLHGHTGKVRVSVETDRTLEDGMVVDFQEFDALWKRIEDLFDHRVILDPRDERLADMLEDLSFGRVATLLAPPTAENVALTMLSMARTWAFGLKISGKITIRFWESPTEWAEISADI